MSFLEKESQGHTLTTIDLYLLFSSQAMQHFDEAIRKTFNLDALSPSVTTTTAAVSRTKSTVFEDEPVNQYIPGEWYFYAPLPAQRNVNVDLTRLLKQYDFSKMCDDPVTTHSLLTEFSSEVNRLKQRCVTDAATEEDLLCYVNFVDVLNRVFENNTSPYSYSVPSADDHDPYYMIRSDKFLFEYLNVLLSLLAHYNNQAVDLRLQQRGVQISDSKETRDFMNSEARLFHLSTEVLTEMLTLCRAPRESYKIVYTEPPRSINNTSNSSTSSSSSSNNLPLKEFVCAFLGGEASIEARLHLCTAKKQETLLRLFTMTSSPDLDREEATTAELYRIAVIHDAYKQAYTLVADSELNRALYDYCRFMAHFWFCTAHLTVVKGSAPILLETLQNHEETPEELKDAREILARLMFVIKEARQIEEQEPTILNNLCGEAEARYNALILELNELTKSFDVQLYDNRQLKEMRMEERDFALPLPQVIKRQQSMFAEARKATLKKCLERIPALSNCQKLLRSLLDKLSQGTAKEWLKVFNGSTATTTAAAESEEGPVMDRSIRIGHFTEREWWLEWIISLYSPVDDEFRLPADLYKRFTEELRLVKQAKRQVK